jgi:hypothetical protein
MARLNRATSQKAFQDALADLKTHLTRGFELLQQQAGQASAASGTGDDDALFSKYGVK